MSSELIKTVNLGSTKSGLAHVGYQLINAQGTVSFERTETGVYETAAGSGIYAALVEFSDGFRGTIMWDSGEEIPVFAAEEYNHSVNGASVLNQLNGIVEQVNFIRAMTAGKWSLDRTSSTMSFYDESGTQLLMEYDLKDDKGNPSIENVFERTTCVSNAPDYGARISDSE
jgi:hypothetical protein